MRYLLLASVIFTAPAVAAPAKHHANAVSHATLPGFVFMGHDPDVVESPPTKRTGAACSPDRQHPGAMDCSDSILDGPFSVAGQVLMMLDRSYYNGKLYYLFGSTSGGSFPGLLEAFTTK